MVSVIQFFKLTDRITINGFSDLNLNKKASNRRVIESKVSFKFNRIFSLVVEGRYNGFENAHPNLEGIGVATGISFRP